MTAQPQPTITELQAQLVTVRERLRQLEAVAMRPIQITIALPDGRKLSPRAWWSTWRKRRHETWLAKMAARDSRRALKRFRKLAAIPRRSVLQEQEMTEAYRESAGLALSGLRYVDKFDRRWRPPLRWYQRVAVWWADRGVRRLKRLASRATNSDVLVWHEAALAGQNQRLAEIEGRWPKSDPRTKEAKEAILSGRRAIELAGEKIRESKA